MTETCSMSLSIFESQHHIHAYQCSSTDLEDARPLLCLLRNGIDNSDHVQNGHIRAADRERSVISRAGRTPSTHREPSRSSLS